MITISYINEIWKPIKGFEGFYDVSNFGRVRSLYRKEKILKSAKDKDGYLIVGLYKNGKGKTYMVHRLVWEAFRGSIPKGMQVNHINENKTDNRLENLELVTPKENCNWGMRNKKIGNANSIPVLQFSKDGKFIMEHPSAREAERQTEVFNNNICNCCKGKCKSAGGFIWKYK